MEYFVYIMTNRPQGSLYVGVTNDLVRRVYEHKNELISGFTKRYKIKRLVYYETHSYIINALQREKNIKQWLRQWKIQLIEEQNPNWEDLWEIICC